MIEAIKAAYRECTNRVNICPDKVLRSIGTVFKEWIDDPCSTDLPHWTWWEVVGHFESFAGRNGDTLLYERHESHECVEEPCLVS